ncbi:hypothetical protein JTE90_027459 [Oedothorax gibbosus]|uniref:Uncharacterized protein n=1 Tax=Oedothorax gibbosus TaxID=931172 RepID=A0AAV6VY96_9ARAC|nr:hypothetical protein JTE90_027459 [Oedothorax gibbosus]
MSGERSKIPKLMEKGSNPRREREMDRGSSRIPRLMQQGSNPRTQRVQELRRRFEAPSNRPAESQRGESSQRSQQARPNNQPSASRSRYRQQGPGPSSQPPASRSRYRQQDPGPSSQPSASRSRYRQQDPGPSSQPSASRSRYRQQGPGPSSQVQAMRQKFDAPSKKPADSQKPRSQTPGLSGKRGQGSSGPVQAMRQRYEALPGGSDSPSRRSRPSQENQDFVWNQPQFQNPQRENNESPPMRAFYDNSIDLGSPSAYNFDEEHPQEEMSFELGAIDEENEIGIEPAPSLRFPPSHSFSPSAFEHYDPSYLEELRHDLERPLVIPDEEFKLSVKIPKKMTEPPPNLEVMKGVVRRSRRRSDRSNSGQEQHSTPSRDEPQNPSFRGSERGQGSAAGRQDLGASGNVQEYSKNFEALSDKSGGSRKEGSRQDSGRKGQGSDEKEVRFEDSLNIRPGPSHPSEHSYYDSLEDRDRPPSFRKEASRQDSGRRGQESGEKEVTFEDSLNIRPGPSQPSEHSHPDSLEERDRSLSFRGIRSSTPQPGPSGGATGGATGGIPDQPMSSQDYEMFYHNNMEKVKHYDSLNYEIGGILSQYIPGINPEDRVSPAELSSVLKDFLEDLHDDLRNVMHELDNLKEQIGGQYPQEDSSIGSSRRSRRRLSGYQASSSPSYDSYHGGPPRPQTRRRRMRANDYDLQSTASPEFPPVRRNLRANVPQHSSTHTQDPQSTHSSLGLSSRLPSSGPPSRRSTRSPSHRGPVETDELMSTNELAPGNEIFDRPGEGHYHSDIEDFIATRKLEPRANTSNARMEDLQAQLREFNLQNLQSSTELSSTTDGSHDFQSGHSESSMADDHSAIGAPLGDNLPRTPSPAMLNRVWNPREMDLQLQRFNAEPQQDSSIGSPDSYQEQPTDSSASVAQDVGNENRVRSPGMFGRMWNPQDMNEQLQRYNASHPQESRESAGRSDRSNSGQEQHSTPSRDEPPNPSFRGSDQYRNSPQQQEYDSGSEEEWDAGCY